MGHTLEPLQVVPPTIRSECLFRGLSETHAECLSGHYLGHYLGLSIGHYCMRDIQARDRGFDPRLR